ncbi:MAG: hypothetical protein AVDCRST_MAG01-01-984, partial [uncultured Rubrobacteraceae bacterium]
GTRPTRSRRGDALHGRLDLVRPDRPLPALRPRRQGRLRRVLPGPLQPYGPRRRPADARRGRNRRGTRGPDAPGRPLLVAPARARPAGGRVALHRVPPIAATHRPWKGLRRGVPSFPRRVQLGAYRVLDGPGHPGTAHDRGPVTPGL